ncbi:MAG TPA: tetratricopeptide repeat protein [Methylococcaceae bacterium]|nr:tetratricopeptide repeat protein [Methylococcaceae bacterium]
MTLGLTACSLPAFVQPEQPLPEASPTLAIADRESLAADRECGGGFTAEQRMYVELVHRMVTQGQYHAALAHLDQLEKRTIAPQTRYLRAEALRYAGQANEAESLYRSLSSGCMAGYGLHGLGLLAAEGGRLEQAEDFLRQAVRERPVDAESHNDLGMVLLLRGQRQSAREEFLTAAELDRKSLLPVENLIVLMLAEKHDEDAHRLAAQRGLNAQDLARLAQRGQRLTESSGSGAPPTTPSSSPQE